MNEVSAQCGVLPSIEVDGNTCEGEFIRFTTVENGNNWDWYFGDGSPKRNTLNKFIEHKYATSGTYEVALVKIGAGACRDSAIFTFTVHAKPTAGFSFSPVTPCAGDEVNFTNTSSVDAVDFKWEFPPLGKKSSQENPTVKFKNKGTASVDYTPQLIVTNANGCQDTIAQIITVNDEPDPGLFDVNGSNFVQCSSTGPQNFDLTVNAGSATMAEHTSFEIDWGDGSPAFTTSPTLASDVSHTYTDQRFYHLVTTVTSTGGCTAVDTFEVFNGSNPAVGIASDGATSGCAPSTFTFNITNTANNTDGTKYRISIEDGFDSTFATVNDPDKFIHTFDTTSCITPNSVFTITLQAFNPCGSTKGTVDAIQISEPPKAEIVYSPDTLICEEQTIAFSLNGELGKKVTYNAGSNSYDCIESTAINWEIFPNAGWSANPALNPVPFNKNNTGSFDSESVNVTFHESGTYTVRMIVANDCSHDTSYQEVCVQAPPTAQFSINQNTFCVPDVVNTVNTSTADNSCDEFTYNWSVSRLGAVCVADSAQHFVFSSGNNTSDEPSFQFNNEGQYRINMALTNVCGTFNAPAQLITAKRKPTPNFNIPTGTCLTDSITPTAISANDCRGTISFYEWQVDNGGAASPNQQNPGKIGFNTGGANSILFIAENECGRDTATKSINVLDPPTNSPGADRTLCHGETSNLGMPAAPGVTYKWNPTTGLSNSNISNPVLTASNTGASNIVRKYYLTATISGCSSLDSVEITIKPRPQDPTIANVDVCEDSVARFSVTAGSATATYEWFDAAVAGNSLGTGSSFTSTALQNTTSFFVETTDHGCVRTPRKQVTATVRKVAKPTAQADATFCIDATKVQLTATPGGGTWTGSKTDPDGKFLPDATGNYEAVYTVSNSFGCVNSDTVDIEVVNQPTIAILTPDTAVCVGSSAFNFRADKAGTWRTSAAPAINTSTGNYNPTQAGTYTITIQTGSGNCAASDDVELTVHALPELNGTPDTTICAGSGAFALTGYSPTGGNWTGTGITNASGTFDPAVSGVGDNHEVTYTYTESTTQCVSTLKKIVLVKALPTVTAYNDTTLCNQPIEVQLTGSPSGGTWSGSVNITSDGKYTPSGVLTETVTYTFEDQFKCSASDDKEIQVINPTQINILTADTAVCINSASFDYQADLNGTWEVIPTTGSPISNTGNFNPSTAGNYEVVVSVGTGNCLSTDTAEITVNALPTVEAGNSPENCVSVSSATLTGFAPAIGAVWSGYGITNSSTGTYSPSTMGDTTASKAYLEFTDANGCYNVDSTEITIHPLPVVTTYDDTLFCNTPVAEQLVAIPMGGTWSGINTASDGKYTPNGVGITTSTYTFTDGNGCTNTGDTEVEVTNQIVIEDGRDTAVCIGTSDIQLVPQQGGGTYSNDIDVTVSGLFTPQSEGLHKVVYKTGVGSCQSVDTVFITVHPLPVITIPAIEACINVDTMSLNEVTHNPAGGKWYGTGVLPDSSSFLASQQGVGVGQVNYVFTDGNGCIDSLKVDIQVFDLTPVYAGPDTVLCKTPFPGQLSGTPVGGIWQGDIVEANGSYLAPKVGVDSNVVYIHTDTHGCINSDTLIVQTVEPDSVFSGTDTLVCVGDAPFFLSPFPDRGYWTGPKVTSNDGLFTPDVVGNYKIYYTIGEGNCRTSDTMEIAVNALPVVDAGVNETVCEGTAIYQLSGESPLGGEWSGTPVLNATTGAVETQNVGTYSITYTYSDPATGCENQDQKQLRVNPNPIVDLGNDITLCQGTQVTDFDFTVNASGTEEWQGTNVNQQGVFTPADVGVFDVSVLFTDVNSCVGHDTIQVTVEQKVAANAGIDAVFCEKDSLVELNPNDPQLVWKSTPSQISADGRLSIKNPGTWQVIAERGTGNCYSTDTALITVNVLPSISKVSIPDICENEAPFTLSHFMPIGGIYQGSGITAGEFQPAVASVGIHNVYYTYTEPATGCVNRDSNTVEVLPMPTAAFTLPAIVCVNVNQQVTDLSTGATTQRYRFTDSESLGLATQHTYSDAGLYNITQVVTANNTCTDTAHQQVEVIAPPTAHFTLDDSIFCGNAQVLFSNESEGEYVSYNWDFDNGQSNTSQNPGLVSFSMVQPGEVSYYPSLTISNICGTDFHSDSLHISSEMPQARFATHLDTICSNVALNVTNLSSQNAVNHFWNWGNGTPIDTIENPLSYTFVTGENDTTFTLTLEVENGCGRDVAQTDVVIIPNFTQAFFSPDDVSGCAPLTVTFSNFSTGGEGYNWDFGNGDVSIVHSPVYTYTEAGTYTASLNTFNRCVNDVEDIEITVLPNPIPDVTVSSDTVCSDVPIDFSLLNNDVSSILWDFDDGEQSPARNVSHTFPQEGDYTVTVTVVSSVNNCPGNLDIPVYLKPNPNIVVTGTNGHICEEELLSIGHASTFVDFIQWDFENSHTSAQDNPETVYNERGDYTITIVGEHAEGCVDTLLYSMRVHPKPNAFFVLSDDTTCADADDLNILNLSEDANDYHWDFGDGQESTEINPTHRYDVFGRYDITLIATNTYQCADTTTQPYHLLQKPIAAADYTEGFCFVEEFDGINLSQYAHEYQWNMGNGEVFTNQHISYKYPEFGNYPAYLMAKNNNGCTDTLFFPGGIDVFPNPIPGFSIEDTIFPIGESYQKAYCEAQLFSEVGYYIQGHLNLDVCQGSLDFSGFEAGRYEVVQYLENQYGCIADTSRMIEITKEAHIFVPNAFTPGSPEGINDDFLPSTIGIERYQLRVFDRWGRIVFESEDRTESWNGLYLNNSEECRPDLYNWTLQTVDTYGVQRDMVGTVMLVR